MKVDILHEDGSLAAGASTIPGRLVTAALAEAQGLPHAPLEQAL